MPKLEFDHPVPELTEKEDPATVAAIEEGIAQLEAGQGKPIEELRTEFLKRCSK